MVACKVTLHPDTEYKERGYRRSGFKLGYICILGCQTQINSSATLRRSTKVLEVIRLDTALAGRASAEKENKGGAWPQKQEAQNGCCRL